MSRNVPSPESASDEKRMAQETLRIGMIHTVIAVGAMMDRMARSRLPDVAFFNIVDESILAALDEGDECKLASRVAGQVMAADRAGADVIVFTCSSSAPAIDVARKLVSKPVVKIDDAMAQQAVQHGRRINVICTAHAAVNPSRAILAEHAAAAGRTIAVGVFVEPDAALARRDGDMEKHDALISERAAALAKASDAIVLAQASMAHLAPGLEANLKLPVLASPELCLEAIAKLCRRPVRRGVIGG